MLRALSARLPTSLSVYGSEICTPALTTAHVRHATAPPKKDAPRSTKIFTDEQYGLMRREREMMRSLRLTLSRVDAVSTQDLDLLRDCMKQLEDLFMVVVVGEFNAGKSSFVNALLGAKFLEEGVTPTTHRINIIRHGATKDAIPSDEADTIVRTFPIDFLKDISIVDTPGTNAIIKRHQEITEHFVPRSELVLFLTAADRPWSESERKFVDSVAHWGKKVVVVLNKVDIIKDPTTLEKVTNFVKSEAATLLGVEPQFFPVSAKMGLQAKLANDTSMLKASGFAALENYVLSFLSSKEKVKLKLTAPLGLAERLIGENMEKLDSKSLAVSEKINAVEHLEDMLKQHEHEMRRDLPTQLARTINIIQNVKNRAELYLDSRLRYERLFALLRTEKNRGAFEREVVSSFQRDADEAVHEFAEWLEERGEEFWKSAHLVAETELSGSTLPAIVDAPPSPKRDLVKRFRRVVDSYDSASAGLDVASGMRKSLLSTLIAQASVLATGSIATLVFVADTVPMFASLFGTLGLSFSLLGLVPLRRMSLRRRVSNGIGLIERELEESMKAGFEKSLLGVREYVDNRLINPIRRDVNAESEAVLGTLEKLRAIQKEVATLRKEVERVSA